MESYAVAYFCEQARLPYGVVTLISGAFDAHANHDLLAARTRLAPELDHLTLEASDRLHRHRKGKRPS